MVLRRLSRYSNAFVTRKPFTLRCFLLFVEFGRSFNQWAMGASLALQLTFWPIPPIVSIRRNYIYALPMSDPTNYMPTTCSHLFLFLIVDTMRKLWSLIRICFIKQSLGIIKLKMYFI